MSEKPKKILAVIGARPQFIKHYPFEKEAIKFFELVTVHTGQHYDEEMSAVFFENLDMFQPNYMLNVGSGSHGVQTGKMMIDLEEIVMKESPCFVVVYGDTNSTIAAALVAAKLNIPLVHIEAGLRSYNKKMPEEVNRVLTDHISSLMLVPSEVAVENLKKEGITKNIFVVGDIMKDLILECLNKNLISSSEIGEDYYYATIHRPYNTDEKERLVEVLNMLNGLEKKVVFAIHPRTRKAMEQFDLPIVRYGNVSFIKPQSYFNNISYLFHSQGLITDSGGMQKEAYWLKKICITIRSETEWIETLTGGWNTLFFDNFDGIKEVLNLSPRDYNETLYGNGKAAEKIVEYIFTHGS